MGNALRTPEPSFTTLAVRAAGYEIRSYPPLVVAEVHNLDNSQSFRTLAGYIGVFSSPANVKSEAISMTAPVVMPHVQSTPMQFILPDKYKSTGEAPAPSNEKVQLKDIPAKRVGVIRYSGNVKATDPATLEKLESLKRMLAADKLLDEKAAANVEWSYCGYDPPFKPGPFRRNEVWIDLHMTDDEVKQKLAEVDAAAAAAATATK